MHARLNYEVQCIICIWTYFHLTMDLSGYNPAAGSCCVCTSDIAESCQSNGILNADLFHLRENGSRAGGSFYLCNADQGRPAVCRRATLQSTSYESHQAKETIVDFNWSSCPPWFLYPPDETKVNIKMTAEKTPMPDTFCLPLMGKTLDKPG